MTEALGHIPGYGGLVSGIDFVGKFRGPKPILDNYKSPLLARGTRSFGKSPIQYLVPDQSHVHYLGAYVTNSWKKLGSGQIEALLYGERRELLDNTSLLIGIDAFYWDAIWGTCRKPNRFGVEDLIARLITESSQRGLPLVLGNVPHENPANILIDSEQVGIKGLWSSQDPDCVDSINRTLTDLCTPANDCYLLDVKGMVDDLNCGKSLALNNGRAYSLFQARPDGVHLSDVASQYVSEQIIKLFEADPPRCTPPSS